MSFVILEVLAVITVSLLIAFMAKKTDEKMSCIILMIGGTLAAVILLIAIFEGKSPEPAEASLPGNGAVWLEMSSEDINRAISKAAAEQDAYKKLEQVVELLRQKALKGELPGQQRKESAQ